MIRLDISKVKFDQNGLVPVIVQDYVSGKILMQAYANEEALRLTVKTGYAHFWSRSRRRLWLKGETSGNRMLVKRLLIDCDGDSIIYQVEALGPACHTGNESCFYRALTDYEDLGDIVEEIKGYFERAQIIEKAWVRDGSRDRYMYVLNPITENVPPPSAKVMAFLSEAIDNMTPSDVDKVVVPESFGIPIAALVAQRKRLPLAIVRKRDLGARPLKEVEYSSGYERGKYYIYGVEPGERVIVIDDAISTGGTMDSVVSALKESGVDVAGAACSVSKEMYGGRRLIFEKHGIIVKAPVLLDLDSSGRLIVEVDASGGAARVFSGGSAMRAFGPEA